MRQLIFASTLLGLALTGGCFDGGLNTNERKVGDQPGGVHVDIGDIAVAPNGEYVVLATSTGLRILRPGLSDTPRSYAAPIARDLRITFSGARRLAFAKTRDVFYVSTASLVTAFDAGNGQRLWTATLPWAAAGSTSLPRLESTIDDRRVVYAVDATLTILDGATGRLIAQPTFARNIVDVDLLPDNHRALVTTAHQFPAGGTPKTTMHVVLLEDGRARSFQVPNCADDVLVTGDGSRAFLAPTVCQRDPVSVIDLAEGREQWTRNLPGFGPVALAPDGTTVAAFMDALSSDPKLFDDARQIPDRKGPRYLLMVIDAKTLAFRSAAVGDALPRYAMTPDGRILLVDHDTYLPAGEPLRLFDTQTLAFTTVEGPAIELDNFVLAPDSTRAYAIDARRLYSIDLVNAKASELPTLDTLAKPVSQTWTTRARRLQTSFAPTNLNLSADSQTLFLRAAPNRLCIYSTVAKSCHDWFTLD